jgi:hypothetical protein
VLLAASRAAVQVGAQPGERGVGIRAGKLELDVAVRAEVVDVELVAAEGDLEGPPSSFGSCSFGS